MCLNGFNIPTHIWLRLYPVWLVAFGVTGSIPKRDAHIYIYTLSENSVPIICLALRRSAIKIRESNYINIEFIEHECIYGV